MAVQRNASRLALAAGLAVIYLVWGSTYLAIGIGLQSFPPFLMAGTRLLATAVLLFAWSSYRGDAKPTARHWRNTAAAGLLLFVGGNGGVHYAQQFAPSGLTALVVATVPAWLALFDWAAVSGRRPRARELAGIALGLGGVGLLTVAGHLEGSVNPTGVGIVVAASAAWAAGSLFAKGSDLPKSPVQVVAMEMLVGGAVLAAMGLSFGEAGWFDPSAVKGEAVIAYAYLILAGLVALPVYTWLFTVTTPAVVGTYAFINPVVAVLLGWVVLNETLTDRVFAAAGLVFLGVGLIAWPTSRPTAPPALSDGSDGA